MASFDYRLNPLYPIKECSSCGALYTTDYCCFDGSLVDKIICDLNKTPDLFQEPPQNCPKCGNLVDGQYCQGCALLPKELKEVWFTYCIENGIFQGLLDTVESSYDNTNVVNAPQELFVVIQDPGENSSQSAHYGYNCQPKVLIILNSEPCNNQTVDEFPQTLPSFDPTCYSGDENSFTYDSKSNIVLSLAWETILEIEHALEDKHCQPEDILNLFQRLHNDVQNIHEELAVYINTPSWDRPIICYNDDKDEDSIVAITPILSTEEPNNSLNSFSIDNIEFIEASPLDSELISSEVMEIVIPEVRGIDVDILLTIKDDILHEKLLNINLLIANIEALKDNPTPYFDFMTKSSSTSLNFPLEETNTFDDSLPESETFCFDSEENSSSSTNTRADISLLDYESFYDDHVKEISSGIAHQYLLSFGNEDTIFDFGISSYHISSFMTG
uniref:Pre-mRNA splicing Prp18-interacting factor n=1 Tax=Tanacetum cinerariifolium TaxID=118510 RepID=A0A6L2MZM9_TANCI|nr:hypothetical protein [Tanacetum cinerariifolium]